MARGYSTGQHRYAVCVSNFNMHTEILQIILKANSALLVEVEPEMLYCWCYWSMDHTWNIKELMVVESLPQPECFFTKGFLPFHIQQVSIEETKLIFC